MLSKMPRVNASATVSVRKHRLIFVASIAIVTGIVSYLVILNPPANNSRKTEFIQFGGRQFSIEVADSDAMRAKGLGGRSGISADEALLFVFDESGKHCFWMKDVSFPIDIVWFNESLDVVDSELSVAPETYPETTFCPDEPARYVLEIKGGEVNNLQNPNKLLIEHML